MIDEIDEEGILLIVDPLKDFFYEYVGGGKKEKGKFFSANAKAIIPSIVELARKRLVQGWLIVCVEDEHWETNLEIELLGKHAMHHTRGAEMIDELSALKNQPNVVKIIKRGFDAFLGESDKPLTGENLEEIIRRVKPSVIEIAGVCTDICVRSAAEQIIAYRNSGRLNRNMRVVIYEDCVATFDDDDEDEEGYTAEEKTQMTFYYLTKWYGAKVIAEAPK